MEQSYININDPDLKILCVYAFEIIASHLNEKPIEIKYPDKFLPYKYPLFVTWSKGKEKSLRGCIGTFKSDDLKNNLEAFAKIAAFKDIRFMPIKQSELASLNCGISLLINFEDGKNPYDWEVGKHGIQIEFEDEDNRYYRATYLPQVAEEQGWDQKTTLKHLIRKAHYYGDISEIEDKIRLRRYQSVKIFMTYEEYIAIKNK